MQVRTLGTEAKRCMAHRQEARVMGSHTRGIFVQTRDEWVLYLTADPQRGPLTLNLDTTPDGLDVRTGDRVTVQEDGLSFVKSNAWIDARKAAVWQPQLPGGSQLATENFRARLDAVARNVVLPQEWDAPGWDAQAGMAGLVALVCERLGRGGGLTPAWDDFALGLLLAFNRWPACLPPGFALATFNAELVQSARERTTTLSANLIACAARGLADERLIAGLDGLATGSLDPVAAAACFNAWGSTSGSFAFQGMRLAFALRLGDPLTGGSMADG